MAEKMDAITLLEQDHHHVDALFKEFEGMSDRARERKMDMYHTIRTELEVHTKIEEEIFYPAVKELDEELIAESIQEHHVIDVLLKELGKLEPADDEFDAKMTVLKENVEHHVEEERNELFPEVKKQMKRDQLMALGEKLMTRKQKLMDASKKAA